MKTENWFDLANLHFMFFDRNEIHIQAFVDFINGKLIPGDSSSLTFYVFEILSFLRIKNQDFKISKFNKWTYKVSEIFDFFGFQISMKYIFPYFPGMFPDFFLICFKYSGLIK